MAASNDKSTQTRPDPGNQSADMIRTRCTCATLSHNSAPPARKN
jgi:hypothetical protein